MKYILNIITYYPVKRPIPSHPTLSVRFSFNSFLIKPIFVAQIVLESLILVSQPWGGHLIKSKWLSCSQHPLHAIAPHLVIGLHDQPSCPLSWDFVCLDLLQDLYMLSYSLWVPMCICPALLKSSTTSGS